jgi:DNA-binding FrmR family transcriptional regulator
MEDSAENLKRLKTIEGHIRGVQRMVDADAYCVDVIMQINAIQAALNKISLSILDNHLHYCLYNAIRGDDPAEQDRMFKEIVDVFEAASKV